MQPEDVSGARSRRRGGIGQVEKELEWGDRAARHEAMDGKRVARVRGEQAQPMPRLTIVIPDKVGVSEWWTWCIEEGLVSMQGLHQEARDRLPTWLFPNPSREATGRPDVTDKTTGTCRC